MYDDPFWIAFLFGTNGRSMGIRKPIRNSLLLIALRCDQIRRILLCTCSSALPPAPNSQMALLMDDITASTGWDTRAGTGWCSYTGTAWRMGPVWGTGRGTTWDKGTGTVLLMVTAMGIRCGVGTRAGRTVQWRDMEQGLVWPEVKKLALVLDSVHLYPASGTSAGMGTIPNTAATVISITQSASWIEIESSLSSSSRNFSLTFTHGYNGASFPAAPGP